MKLFDRLLELNKMIYTLNKAYIKNKSAVCKELLQEQKEKEESILNKLSYDDLVDLEIYYRKTYDLHFDNFFLLELVNHPYIETPIFSLYLKLYERLSFYLQQSFSDFSPQEMSLFLNTPYYRRHVKRYREKLYYNQKMFQNYLHEKSTLNFDDVYLLNSLSIEKTKELDYIPKHIKSDIYNYVYKTFFMILTEDFPILENERLKIIKAIIKIIPSEEKKSFFDKIFRSLKDDLNEHEQTKLNDLIDEILKENKNRKKEDIFCEEYFEDTYSYDVSFDTAINYEIKFEDLMRLEKKILLLYKKIINSESKEEREKFFTKLSIHIDEEHSMLSDVQNFTDFLIYIEKAYLKRIDFMPDYLFSNERYCDWYLCYERLFNYDFYKYLNKKNDKKSDDDEYESNIMLINETRESRLESLEKIQQMLVDFMFGKISKKDLRKEIIKADNKYDDDENEKIYVFFENLKYKFFNALYQSEYQKKALLYAFTDNEVMEKLIFSNFEEASPFPENEKFYLNMEEKKIYLNEVKDYISELEESYPVWINFTGIYLDCCYDYLGLKNPTLKRKYGTIKKHKKEDKDE